MMRFGATNPELFLSTERYRSFRDKNMHFNGEDVFERNVNDVEPQLEIDLEG